MSDPMRDSHALPRTRTLLACAALAVAASTFASRVSADVVPPECTVDSQSNAVRECSECRNPGHCEGAFAPEFVWSCRTAEVEIWCRPRTDASESIAIRGARATAGVAALAIGVFAFRRLARRRRNRA